MKGMTGYNGINIGNGRNNALATAAETEVAGACGVAAEGAAPGMDSRPGRGNAHLVCHKRSRPHVVLYADVNREGYGIKNHICFDGRNRTLL